MELERKQISSNQEEDVEKINRKINQRNLVLLHKKHCHLEMQLKKILILLHDNNIFKCRRFTNVLGHKT